MQENQHSTNHKYCENFFHRTRLKTQEVKIGSKTIGGENPILIQSMTTTDTMDTTSTVEQSIRMIEAGCELVRVTAPSKSEAENLKNIKNDLLKAGYNTPIVADIHFTPNAAEIAAKLVEKVRVNPGNYADKKKFEVIDYTDETYQEELIRIENKFTPLVQICKEHHTAMRIGTNHGSLSDRILSRYGDTPEGMVESALEFIKICEKNNFYNLVISMKASNTIVMVQAYRLLVAKMLDRGVVYPLHLGVTEAGDGEDGRIKSAVGIGALLEDGIGDTIRVSLTEEPEYEMPVAIKIANKYRSNKNDLAFSPFTNKLTYNPFQYEKRITKSIENIGGKNVPIVINDLSKKQKITAANLFSSGYIYSIQLDKWNILDQAADYIYIGNNTIDFEIPGTLRILCNYENWKENNRNKTNHFPLITNIEDLFEINSDQTCFINIIPESNYDWDMLIKYEKAIFILDSSFDNTTHIFRNFHNIFSENNISNPVVLKRKSSEADAETFQLHASSEIGSLFIDGFGDGIWLDSQQPNSIINSTSFGILQATRTRISKTEYISCPSCGRTLFDLQETTAKIRAVTSHLKGIKIGIMGCIVNGPGEMADADYGYVGTGPGKINLYKEKTVVKRNIPENEAVNSLVELIKENGDWTEPLNYNV